MEINHEAAAKAAADKAEALASAVAGIAEDVSNLLIPSVVHMSWDAANELSRDAWNFHKTAEAAAAECWNLWALAQGDDKAPEIAWLRAEAHAKRAKAAALAAGDAAGRVILTIQGMGD